MNDPRDISEEKAQVQARKKQKLDGSKETKKARRRWSKEELIKLDEAIKLVGPDANKLHRISPFDLRSTSSIRHKLGDMGYIQEISKVPTLGGNGQPWEPPTAAPTSKKVLLDSQASIVLDELDIDHSDLDDGGEEDDNDEAPPKEFLQEPNEAEDVFHAPAKCTEPIIEKKAPKFSGYQVKSLLKGSEQTIGTQAMSGVKIPPIIMLNEDYFFLLFPKIDQVVLTFKVQEQYILVNALLTGLEGNKVDGFIQKYMVGEKRESVINAFKENYHTEFYIKTPKKVDTSFCERINDTHIEGIKAKFKKMQVIL